MVTGTVIMTEDRILLGPSECQCTII